MKDEFVLYFSAIPVARLLPPAGEGAAVTGSVMDPYTLEWSRVHPISREERKKIKALTRMDGVGLLLRLGEYERFLSGEAETVSAPIGQYQRGRDGLWLQRQVKFPANVRMAEGRAAAFLTPSREGMAALVRPGLEQLTPLALWREYAGESLSPVEPARTFRIPTADGQAELATDLYLPRHRQGPVPAVLIRTPYNREDGAAGWFRYVHRGYAVVIQDVRGKGDSSGEWVPHRHEMEDGDTTLSWIAAQDWCDGRIGTAGGSYLGYVQWAMAATGNPHLKAMVSVVTSGSSFVDQPRKGGCYVSGMFPWMFSVSGQRYDPSLMDRPDWEEVLAVRPLRDIPEKALGRRVPFLEQYLQHRDCDEFWRQGEWAERFWEKGRPVPALIQSGWFDDDGMGTTEALDLSRDWPHRRVILGPWQHGGNSRYDLGALSFGEDALRYELDLLHLRWLDRFLRGRENGVDREPPVEYYTTGEEAWHTAAAWPPRENRELTLWLDGKDARTSRGDGTLREVPPAEPGETLCLYDPADPAKNLMELSDNELAVPADYTGEEERQDYLCYTTSPLERDLTVTGDCEAELYLVSDGEDADLLIRLCDVDPQGRSVKLTDALLCARYREGFSSPRPLEPGVPARMVLRTGKLSHRFPAGHRLRLSVTFSGEGLIFPNSGTAAGYDSAVIRKCQNGLRTGPESPCKLRLPVED